jgi:hypothetical protein
MNLKKAIKERLERERIVSIIGLMNTYKKKGLRILFTGDLKTLNKRTVFGFISFAAVTMLFIIMISNYYRLYPIYSEAIVSSNIMKFTIYKVDDAQYILRNSSAIYFLINRKEKGVFKINNYGHRFLFWLVWPRDSTQGVLVGDGVKGDPSDNFAFEENNTIINYYRPSSGLIHLIVQFPDPPTKKGE